MNAEKLLDFDNNPETEYYRHDMNDAIRHGMCVSLLASSLARELGLSDEEVHEVAVAGMLHDIGKLQISPYIYGRKEATLKIEEMRYVRLHAKLGAEILKTQRYDSRIAEIVLYHHENYDGSGYPFCMRGEEIPLGSRIIRVCDVFSALISDRPYRKAFDADTALVMVIDEVRHFDMKIFLTFQKMINTSDILKRIDSILHDDLPEFHG
ncbi:MAG: HD domain-containing protein [Coprococcus sp.]|nr:HD domain-containing protein [Coprococcus sp.]